MVYVIFTTPTTATRLLALSPSFRRFIRRYGSDHELFLVEVGRRADSGEGLFKFKTTTPEQLQTAVKARMNRGSGRCSTPAAVEDLYATVNKPKRNNSKVLTNAL